MPCTCSSRRLGVALLLLAASCTTPMPRHPRPALTLPPTVAARYELPGPLQVVGLQQAGERCWQGELRAGPELAHFHLQVPPGPPRPLLVLVPILAGGESLLQMIAARMVGRGFAVGWCERAASALRPPQRGPELEQLFRRTVIHQRMLLSFGRSSDLVLGSEACVLGISLGGMVSVALAAVEPGLRATATCLAGADLADLVLHSQESRVLRWRQFRREVDGIGDGAVGDELRRWLDSDPLHLAGYVPTGRILLVEARFDDVVPPRNQRLLWEALGRPELYTLPLGHYSAALALNPILEAASGFFTSRLGGKGTAASPSQNRGSVSTGPAGEES